MIPSRNKGAFLDSDDCKLPTAPVNREATREQLENCSDDQLKSFLKERGFPPDDRVTRKMMIDILMVID